MFIVYIVIFVLFYLFIFYEKYKDISKITDNPIRLGTGNPTILRTILYDAITLMTTKNQSAYLLHFCQLGIGVKKWGKKKNIINQQQQQAARRGE